jgi:5-methylthioadenosine/S-adenosylhomocysteine deaminase
MDMLDEARLAALFQIARTGVPSAVSAQTALELATIGGAHALGLADRIGSLQVGKAADLAAFSLGGSRTTPAQDPVTTAIYSLSGTPATFVAVAGEHLVEDGRMLIHPGTLHDRVTFLGKALAAWQAPT